MADKPTTSDKGGPDDTEHLDRDPFGFLEGRPWYRHPLAILTIAGAPFLALTFFMAATRTAGVPIFGVDMHQRRPRIVRASTAA